MPLNVLAKFLSICLYQNYQCIQLNTVQTRTYRKQQTLLSSFSLIKWECLMLYSSLSLCVAPILFLSSTCNAVLNFLTLYS